MKLICLNLFSKSPGKSFFRILCLPLFFSRFQHWSMASCYVSLPCCPNSNPKLECKESRFFPFGGSLNWKDNFCGYTAQVDTLPRLPKVDGFLELKVLLVEIFQCYHLYIFFLFWCFVGFSLFFPFEEFRKLNCWTFSLFFCCLTWFWFSSTFKASTINISISASVATWVYAGWSQHISLGHWFGDSWFICVLVS